MAVSKEALQREKELLELQKEGKLLAEQQKELAQLQADIEKESAGSAKDRLDIKIQELDIAQQRKELFGEEEAHDEATLAAAEAYRAALEEEILQLTAKGQLNAQEKKDLEELQEMRQDSIKLIDDTNARLKERNKLQEDYNKQVEDAAGFAASLGNSIGLASSYQQSLLGSMDKTLTSLAGNEKAQEAFKEQLKETFSIGNMFAGLWARIGQMTMKNAVAYNEATTSFNAATGAAGEYNAAIEDASRGASALGVGTAEAGAAMGALHANMSGFTNLSKTTAATLAQGTAALEGLGISGATTAKTLDNLTKHMGLSAEAAMKQQTELAKFAAGIGVAPAKMAEDFAAATPLLVKYGQAGEKVFKNLAKTAKATGIEMNALLGIANQFDTFEGSAQAVGKLNALLGGPMLNSVEMLTASEDERIEMMKQAVVQSGKSWESMNKFEKQALMSAAGISDLDTAGRMFGENQEEVTEQQKNMNEMLEKAQSVTKKLEMITAQLAVTMGPLIDTVSSWMTVLSTWIDKNKETVQTIAKVILAVGGIVLAFKTAAAVVSLFGTAATMLRHPLQALKKPAKEAAKEMGEGMAQGIRAVGKAAAQGAIGLLALGVAALLIGGGIALAALGIAQVAKEMKGMGLEALALVAIVAILAAAFYFMIPALVGMATAGTAAAPALLALGLAVLMIGAGIGLVIGAISLLVTSITALMTLFVENVTVLPQVALGMFMIAGAMGAMALAGLGFPLIAAGFGAMAVGVGALALALGFIKTEDIIALGELGKALGNMTLERSVAFKASMEGFEAALDAADNAGVDVLVGASKFLEMAGGTPAKEKETAPVPVKVVNNISAGGGAVQGPTTVKLILNDREFAKAVIKVMNDKLDLRTG